MPLKTYKTNYRWEVNPIMKIINIIVDKNYNNENEQL